MRAGTTFSAWSYLKPRFPAGAKTVKVKLYRYKSGKRNYIRTYSAVNSDYSSYIKYKARIRLTTKAKYRFKAYTSTTATWDGTSSSYSKVELTRFRGHLTMGDVRLQGGSPDATHQTALPA